MFRKLLLLVCTISLLFIMSGIGGCGKKAEETKEMKQQEQMKTTPDTGAVDTTAMDTTGAPTM